MTSTPPVVDLSVRPIRRARQEGLLEAVIDAPADGGTSGAWAVRVRGHVLDVDGPVRAIEAVVPGTVLATASLGLPTPDVA
ncbi:MAG: hypothetical protein ACRDJC_24920, partial [Thermomicrobiales bacterium]